MSLPDFKSSKERDEYIIKHAKLFTAVRFMGRGKYHRIEAPTQAQAEAVGERMSQEVQGSRWMIYAVLDTHDAYVKTITAKKG